MASKNQGGNKKRPSPSDEKYQQRRKMTSLGSINKDKAHLRHNLRMGLDPKYAQNLTPGGGQPHRNGHSRAKGEGPAVGIGRAHKPVSPLEMRHQAKRVNPRYVGYLERKHATLLSMGFVPVKL